MSHKYSIEQLYHFQCVGCTKWWSIGDYQLIVNDEIICPHCGLKDIVEPHDRIN